MRGMRLSILTATVLGLVVTTAPALRAQVFDTEAIGQEVLSSDFFGADARAMGMGNTGLALSNGGAALIYNPANLARIKRIEVRAGLSHLRFKNETDLDYSTGTFSDGRDLNKTRINALSLTVPVPTYRGSLVFGFGLHRVNSFDRAFGVLYDEVLPEGLGLTNRGRELETGGLWKWTAGGAIDISPRVSTGLSVHLLTGNDKYRWNQVDNTYGTEMTINQAIDLDYVGVSATAGVSYALSDIVTTALTIETPTYLSVEENATWDSTDIYAHDTVYYIDSYSNYELVRPFVFALGVAGSFERFNLAADVRYSDWTQLDFDYDDPALDADENNTLRFIQDNLTEVVSLHLGGEYLIPSQGVTLRAGYFLDPLPVDDRYVESQRKYFTAGVGLLIDRVMTLDLAYVHGGYKVRNDDPGWYFADYKIRRLFVTFGYRI